FEGCVRGFRAWVQLPEHASSAENVLETVTESDLTDVTGREVTDGVVTGTQHLTEDLHGLPVDSGHASRSSNGVAFTLTARSTASGSSAASSSASSGCTIPSALLGEKPFPEPKSISMDVDACSSDLTVFAVTLKFDIDAFQGEGLAGKPCLDQWLVGGAFSTCKDWLTFLFPGQDPERRLVASNVTAEELEPEYSDMPSSGVPERLEFSNLTHYMTKPWARQRFSKRRLRQQQLQQQQQQAMPSIHEDAISGGLQ
ncbi:unnamed protein product, partial [Polarella glacialis]